LRVADVEVEEEADGAGGEAEVGEDLGDVDGVEGFDGLDLDDDEILVPLEEPDESRRRGREGLGGRENGMCEPPRAQRTLRTRCPLRSRWFLQRLCALCALGGS